MKINFIYIILFFIFVISIYNLFYKHSLYKLFNVNTKPSKFLDISNMLSTDDKLFCSMTGYKCEDDSCDCKSICKGQYTKFKIYPDENVIMFNEKLSPGTYCLPNGFEHCNVQQSTPIYSVNGWVCISKNTAIWNNNHLVACQNAYAADNSLNYLIDRTTDQRITANDKIDDYYELLPNGQLRYQCECKSLDKNNNRLISFDEIPFKCVSDYCLAKLNFRRGIPGWNNITKQCDCGHLLHEDPNDLTSPCINESYKLKDIHFTGTVNCMTLNSLNNYPIYCGTNSNSGGVLNFEKIFNFSDNPLDYLNKII